LFESASNAYKTAFEGTLRTSSAT